MFLSFGIMPVRKVGFIYTVFCLHYHESHSKSGYDLVGFTLDRPLTIQAKAALCPLLLTISQGITPRYTDKEMGKR